MKRFVLAPDSFKGTMTAQEICDIWSDAIRKYIPDAHIDTVPMADGGEGLVNAFLQVVGGTRVPVTAQNPFGKPMDAFYGILPGNEAILEMAACAGLPLMGDHLDPLHATTFGVGEMLLDAKARGVKKILLGLGGSATNDGGIGMASALGWRFTDENGSDLAPIAENLPKIAHIIKPASPLGVAVEAACDVDNPLTGPAGATYTFGPQKGVQGDMLVYLDAGLKNLAHVMARDLGADVERMPGAGAAGGLGAAVVAFLDGSLKPGIDMLLDAAHFDALLENADMVFTGEGRIDWQSAHGKVPVGVSRRAKARGIACLALCGAIGKNAEAVYEQGVTALFSAVSGACTFEDIQRTCREDMRVLAESVVRTLLIPRA